MNNSHKKPIHSNGGTGQIRPVYKHSQRSSSRRHFDHQLESPAVAPVRKSDRFSRRDFFKLGISTLGVLALVEAGVVGYLYFKSRSHNGQVGGKVTAGPASSFPPGSVTEFSNEGFFLINSQAGDLKAVYRRCPHLGCTVEWKTADQHFYCPCHGSSFEADGTYQKPPVPRSLDIFPVNVDNGMVIVDTTKPLMSDQIN
jgi:cytochrome b6-f complex iron-sulfur subunit